MCHALLAILCLDKKFLLWTSKWEFQNHTVSFSKIAALLQTHEIFERMIFLTPLFIIDKTVKTLQWK
jgi:hypothetical protein